MSVIPLCFCDPNEDCSPVTALRLPSSPSCPVPVCPRPPMLDELESFQKGTQACWFSRTGKGTLPIRLFCRHFLLCMPMLKEIPLPFVFTAFISSWKQNFWHWGVFFLYFFVFFKLYSDETGCVQWDNGKIQDLPYRKDLRSEGREVVLWVWGSYCRRHESWLDQARLSAGSGTWLRRRSFCFWWL